MHWQFHRGSDLGQFAATWNALNAAAGDLPFLRTEFLLPALREFGAGDELLGILVGDALPIAAGLFRQRKFGIWETFQPAQLPLGAFLLGRGQSLEAVLAGLAPTLPGVALSVAVSQQDPDNVPRPEETPWLWTLDYIETARVNVAGSFDDYWAARGKNLKTNMKRQRAKLAADGLETTLEVVTRAESVADAIADYGRLESSGWKGTEGTAVSAENAQGRFYRSMFEALCRNDLARIYRYRFGDRVVAMDLCLDNGHVLVVLKTAFDESFKALSPAFLMRQHYFRTIFDEARLKHIEFFGKVMEWHLRWTDDVRTLYHVNRYRWRWVHAMHRSLRTARSERQATDPTGEAHPA